MWGKIKLVNAQPADYAASMPRYRTIPASSYLQMIFTLLSVVTWCVGTQVGAVQANASGQGGIVVPSEAAAILLIDEVRIGMKGYGLSVFHGDNIEPFAVEVVSVMRNFTPQRNVIWIRCPDERMQQLGPVQGMSGSPIYLWAEGEAQTLGQGGKLIGAFAYGFMLTKDCYVGVQPIEQMRRVASVDAAQPPSADTSAQTKQSTDWWNTQRELSALLQQHAPALAHQWREQVLLQMLSASLPASFPTTSVNSVPTSLASSQRQHSAITPDGLTLSAEQAQPMLLPMSVRSPAVAQLFGPMLAARGLSLMAAPQGLPIGQPPTEIKLDQLQIAPGSTLSIPLAFGDIDLSAVGTVTEVLPDGRVLGFGHPMFGEGPAALPMASGFVHYVVPSHLASFKLAGSGNIVGSIVRDESAAVLGRPHNVFTTAPVKIRVQRSDRAAHEYQYQMVYQRRISPMIAAILALESVNAEVGLPPENTLVATGKLRFSGGRELPVRSITPAASPMAVAFQLLMPIMMLSENPFESLRLEGMELTLDIQPGIKALSLVEARVEQTQLKPGKNVRIHLTLQPYGQPSFTRSLDFALPPNLPDGDYAVTISDARTYQGMMMQYRPHLMRINNIDDLVGMMREMVQLRDDALYLTMPTPGEGLAVGRAEMPHLPSSRRAMLTAPSGTSTMPMGSWIEKLMPMEAVTQGSLSFMIQVRRDGPAR